jgi:hypothetical protein
VPWRIAIDYTLKRAQIIRRITQAWLLLVIVGSLQPARLRPSVALHRGIHWLAFAGAAFLLLLLSRNRRQEIRGAVAACLLGLSLEYVQHLVYRNPMEWRDVRDDTFAVLAAFALYQLAGTCRAVFAATRAQRSPRP